MNVRELKAPELKSLLALYQHLQPADDAASDSETVEAVWQELRVSPYHKYFGAYVDGQLVSCCALTLSPSLIHGCRPYGLIENVVTHTANRGQGLAKAVIDKALDFSWLSNCYKVVLVASRSDEASLHLFESAGFGKGEMETFVAGHPNQPAVPN